MKKTSIASTLTLIALGLALFAAAAAGLQASDEAFADAAIVPDEIPEDAKKAKNPYAKDPESASRGEMIFSSQCTMCHGADGAGTGDLVERLGLEIPDFTNAEWQKLWSEGSMFYVITKGHGDMPGQKDRLEDKIKWDLVSYVRSLAK